MKILWLLTIMRRKENLSWESRFLQRKPIFGKKNIKGKLLGLMAYKLN